jgi:quercetin dioxygenase-like cupin family protein
MHRSILLLLFTAALFAQTNEVEITDEPHHHLTLANDYVRVFYVDVPPGESTLTHWHRHDYIYVTLGDTELTNEVVGKPPVSLKLTDGDTRLSPGPFAHLVRNAPGKSFRNVTVELLQDDKLRQSPAHWDSAHPDEDRGLEILHGGTKEILWVKDGVRATEFELQPAGVVPMNHYDGPHLLVAVNDFEIRDEVKGRQAAAAHFKSGDSKWLSAGYSDSITNVGHTPARFVMLEFH